jgi:hypothetical protein
MRLSVLACVIAFAVPAGATPLREAPPDPGATAAAEVVFEAELSDAREVGAMTQVLAWPVDLDGDGEDELVGQIYSLFICGNFNCVFVLQPDGAGGYKRLLFSSGMDAVEVLEARTDGWLDLAVWRPDELGGPVRLVWTGSDYGLR